MIDSKHARQTAHATAKALQHELESLGIRWPFIRGEVSQSGQPLVAMGRVHEETARELIVLLRKVPRA